jgi:CRISPR-associated protein Csm5
MDAVRTRFAEARAAAEARKVQQRAEQAAAVQAEVARQAAEAERIRRQASLSDAMREIEALIEHFAKRAEQLAGRKERPNGADHQKAGALAKTALEASDWTPEEKAAAAHAIETWLPKVVAVDIKDVRKKLKLGMLRSNP